jgi:hypothetical protein
MRTNVVGYDRAGSYETTCAESYSANDSCVSSDRHSFFDPRFDRYPIRVAASRRQVVSQNSVWTKKHVVGYVHVLPDADSVFNRYVIADCDSALDKSVVADVTAGADNGVFQNMSKRPYASAFANRVRFDQCFLMNEWCLFYFAHSVN